MKSTCIRYERKKKYLLLRLDGGKRNSKDFTELIVGPLGLGCLQKNPLELLHVQFAAIASGKGRLLPSDVTRRTPLAVTALKVRAAAVMLDDCENMASRTLKPRGESAGCFNPTPRFEIWRVASRPCCSFSTCSHRNFSHPPCSFGRYERRPM